MKRPAIRQKQMQLLEELHKFKLDISMSFEILYGLLEDWTKTIKIILWKGMFLKQELPKSSNLRCLRLTPTAKWSLLNTGRQCDCMRTWCPHAITLPSLIFVMFTGSSIHTISLGNSHYSFWFMKSHNIYTPHTWQSPLFNTHNPSFTSLQSMK